MRKLYLSLVGLIVFAAIANAGKVTKQQALQKAQQFMRGRNLTPANVKSLSRGQTNDDAFYIFRGIVIFQKMKYIEHIVAETKLF